MCCVLCVFTRHNQISVLCSLSPESSSMNSLKFNNSLKFSGSRSYVAIRFDRILVQMFHSVIRIFCMCINIVLFEQQFILEMGASRRLFSTQWGGKFFINILLSIFRYFHFAWALNWFYANTGKILYRYSGVSNPWYRFSWEFYRRNLITRTNLAVFFLQYFR